MRLGALGSLQRGFENLRANWQLILVIWLQTALNLGLGLVALLPFFFVLDLEAPPLEAAPAVVNAWMLDTIEHLAAQLAEPAFWLALVSSSAVCLALLALTGFFQAGIYGVLVEGDRRVPPDRRDAEVSGFRAFSWREFQSRGGRHLWAYFWLYNLILLGWLLWVLLGALVVVAMGLVGQQAGLAAGLAIGCAAVLPMAFLLVLAFFWVAVGQVEISTHDAGPWTALKRSLPVLVRRLPAVTLLFLLFAVTAIGVGMVFLMLSLPLNAGLAFAPALRRVFGLGLQAVQWLASGVVQLVLAATLVALYRGETAGGAGEAER